MKKVWALVLSLAMILTLASFPTFAAESEKLDLAAIATITTTATAGSDENNTVSVGKLYDGVTDDSASIWMDPWNSSISPVLTFELNGLYSLDKIVMYVGNNKAPKGIKVEVAGNDGVYTTVKDEEISSEQSNSYWAPIAVTFEGLNLTGVRYVRFTLTKVDSYNTRVREVEMYGAMESALPSPVKIVDVSASLAPYQQTLPIHASDGDTGSMFAAQGKGYITFELDKWYDLSTFDITFGSPSWGGTDMTPKAFNVSVSSDGTNFTQAYTYSAEAGLGGGLQSLTAQSFDTDVAKTAKYVRVEITTQASWIWSIAEFSAIGTALDITAEEYTVKYVDIFGNEVSTAKAGSAIVGKTVTETAPAVTGYSVTGNGKQQLAISENAEENVLTFVYLKDDLASATVSAVTTANMKSEIDASHKVENTYDGNKSTAFAPDWMSPDSKNRELVWTLDSIYDLQAVSFNWGGLWNNDHDPAAYVYTVAVSSNGVDWETVKSVNDETSGKSTGRLDAYAITANNVKYVRVVIDKAGSGYLSLAEATFYGSATVFSSKGAQMRLPDGAITAGLRFAATVDKATFGIGESYSYAENNGVTFGMYLLPKDMLDGYSTLRDYINAKTTLGDAVDVIGKNVYSQDANELTYTAVLIDIPETAYNRDIVALPYVKYNGTIEYGTEMTRSYYSVAKAMRTSGAELTEAQIAALDAIINAVENA
ncbi:MAG TPA: hypothetical protein DCE08_05910 [Ruminococcaceae bacterium]|nr:hypothetical protein [Oscillospiraceae bacterium]